MGILDGLLGQAKNIDLGALASQVGLSQDEVQAGGESILSKLASGDHDADSAAASAAAETGISADKLQAILPALASSLGDGGVEGVIGKLREGGLGGLLGSSGQDGEGGALSGLANMAKGLFGRS